MRTQLLLSPYPPRSDFERIDAQLRAYDEKREQVIKRSRDIQKLSKQVRAAGKAQLAAGRLQAPRPEAAPAGVALLQQHDTACTTPSLLTAVGLILMAGPALPGHLFAAPWRQRRGRVAHRRRQEGRRGAAAADQGQPHAAPRLLLQRQ